MRTSRYAALAAVALLSYGAQASAADAVSAQAGSVKGSVLVVHDGHLAPLAANTALAAGDRIISTDTGGASIRFADGCTLPLGASEVTTLGAQSPCAASGLFKTGSPMQVGGETGTLILGFLAVGLVTWAVFAANDTNGNGTSPLSP